MDGFIYVRERDGVWKEEDVQDRVTLLGKEEETGKNQVENKSGLWS